MVHYSLFSPGSELNAGLYPTRVPLRVQKGGIYTHQGASQGAEREEYTHQGASQGAERENTHQGASQGV